MITSVLLNLLSMAVGALVTWLVTKHFARRTAEAAEERFRVLDHNVQKNFEITARFLERFSREVLEDESIDVSFTWDDDGRIIGTNVTLAAESGSFTIEGHDAELTKQEAPPEDEEEGTDRGE